METISIGIPGAGSVSGVVSGPACAAEVGVVLGHGAGNDMTNPLVVAAAEGLAERGHATLRFNFPYKELGRKAPDPRPKLEQCYAAAIVTFVARARPRRLVIGGKSLGGRIASLLAAGGLACDGLVFLGYPLHPAGRKDQLRGGHLAAIPAPMLFVEGTRDPLCDLELLRPVLATLGERAALHVVAGGDHSFDLLKSARRPRGDVYGEIVAAVDGWLQGRFGGSRV